MNKHEVLQQFFGHSTFRPGQEVLVDALLQGRDALGIMPTGAGKSICYQVPALVREGITLVISPLISLMKDQVAALRSNGISAAYLNSSLTPSQMELAMARAAQGAYRIIYVAPERLESYSFRDFAAHARLALIAVDEAHCVSQWGQDFRPNYLKIADFIDALPVRPPVGAFTATATERVKQDIIKYLRLRSPELTTTGFDRPNLYFDVQKPKDRFQALVRQLKKMKGQSGIIYCATRKNVEDVTDKLQAKGYAVSRYHAGLSDTERAQAQEDFQYDRIQLIVATNAFGMGIDKSNVSFVIHYNMPKSMEAYYQEAGRAGRDGSDATCTMFFNAQDVITGRWMINHGEPNPELTESEQQLVRRNDLQRLRDMENYATSPGCLRNKILRYFGQSVIAPCGNCGGCLGNIQEEPDLEPDFSSDFAFKAPASSTGTIERSYAFDSFERPAPFPTKPKEVAPEEPLPTETDPDDLIGQLKACRMTLAKGMRMPPYIICDDKTLTDMAAKMPLNPDELLKVHGMGINKVGKYGNAFLDVLRAYAEKHPTRRTAPTVHWSTAELRQLKRGVDAGVTIEQLAAIFAVSTDAVTAGLNTPTETTLPKAKGKTVKQKK